MSRPHRHIENGVLIRDCECANPAPDRGTGSMHYDNPNAQVGDGPHRSSKLTPPPKEPWDEVAARMWRHTYPVLIAFWVGFAGHGCYADYQAGADSHLQAARDAPAWEAQCTTFCQNNEMQFWSADALADTCTCVLPRNNSFQHFTCREQPHAFVCAYPR